MSTSVVGVNQRSAQSASPPGGRGCTKAVSDRLTSAATCWSQDASGNPGAPGPSSASRTRTPAGFPVKGRWAKASTILMRMGRR